MVRVEVIGTAAAVGGSHQPKVTPLSIADLPPLVVLWRRLSVSNGFGRPGTPARWKGADGDTHSTGNIA